MKEIIWSVCSGDNCLGLQGFVRSLRSSGYSGDIVTWSEYNISGAENIPLDFNIKMSNNGMWKFDYMNKMNQIFPDALLAYFSPYHYCANNQKKSFSEIMKDEDAFCFLESNVIGEDKRREEWAGIQNFRLYDTSRNFGNLHDKFFNLNANHFFVKPNFAKDFYSLIKNAESFILKRGYGISDELCLALVINSIYKDEDNMLINSHKDFYGIDSMGIFKEKLPDGNPWESSDWITGKKSLINPSISFIPGNSVSLRNLGRASLGARIVSAQNPSSAPKPCSSCQRAKAQKQEQDNPSEGS